MLKFLGVGKNRRVRDEMPSAIPGHLFRDRPEEDGFVVVGETVAEQKETCSLDYSIGQPPAYEELFQKSQNHIMGSGSSAGTIPLNYKTDTSNDYGSRIIQVQPSFDHIEPHAAYHRDPGGVAPAVNPSSQSEHTSYKERTSTPRTSMSFSVSADQGAGVVNAWRDVPFQLSPRYFSQPSQNMETLLDSTHLNLADFYYDFSREKAVLRT